MSRIRKAAVAASFGYGQFAVAMIGGIVLVPVTLHYLGARTYGLWLATGELLGYAAMVDLGVVGVLPWMLAEADGRRDRDQMRALIANGLVVGVVIGVGYVTVASLLWSVVPWALGFTASDRAILFPALALVVAAMTVSYPLRVFSAAVAGLQDVRFNGWIGLAQGVLGPLLTVWLLWAGYGVLALAVAAAIRPLVSTVACVLRMVVLAPDLLARWPRPSLAEVRHLLTNGLGGWLGAFGWQLLVASNNLVIARIGSPELVPVYACTAKLGAIGTQLAWVIPDAGLVGLAQLHGEQHAQGRVRSIVMMMLRVHLILAGVVMCAVLAFNPAFVTRWVGREYFGGLPLHLLLTAGIVVFSVIHGALTAASVLGNRLLVGSLTLVNGAAQVGCALVLGWWWGLAGIAAAGLLTGLLISIPASLALLAPVTGITLADLWRDAVRPWLRLATPSAAVAVLAAGYADRLGFVGAGLVATMLAGIYVWWVRPLYVGLPLDSRLSRWLTSLRLLSVSPQPVAPGEPG